MKKNAADAASASPTARKGPCSGRISRLVQIAMNQTQRQIALRRIVVGLQGEILKDEAP